MTVFTDGHIRQVNQILAAIYPGTDPFFWFLSRISQGKALNARKYEWMRKGKFPDTVNVTVQESSSGTSFAVTSTAGLTADMLLRDPVSTEIIKVKTVDSATAFTAYPRGYFGGGTAATVEVGTDLEIMSVARTEGGSALEVIGIEPELDYNYAQQFEICSGTTDFAQEVQAHYANKNPRMTARMDAALRNRHLKERAFLFGQRALPTAAQQSTTRGSSQCGGVEYYIRKRNEHIWSAGGAFTYGEFDENTRQLKKFSKTGRFLGLCSERVAGIVGRWQLANHQADMRASQTFGTNVHTVTGGGYQVKIVSCLQFDELAGYEDKMFIIDMDQIEHLVGIPEQTNLEIEGPKKNGSHEIVDQITSVETIAYLNDFAGAIWEDIAA
jgi:hypothetical protein